MASTAPNEIATPFYMRVLEEGTGVYSVFLLLPFLFRFARVYLFERKGWNLLG